MELTQTQWSLPVWSIWINSPETTSKFRTHSRVGRCRPSSNGFTCCNNTCTFLRKLRKAPLPSISLSWPQWLLRFSFVLQHPTLSCYNVRVGDENKGNDQWRYIILLTFNYLCSVSQLTLTYSMKSRDHWGQCFWITYSETCIKRTIIFNKEINANVHRHSLWEYSECFHCSFE